MFTPQQTAGWVNQNREQYDQLGRRVVVPTRTYMERKGFVLEPKFVFIDGRTGATLYSETQRREVLYQRIPVRRDDDVAWLHHPVEELMRQEPVIVQSANALDEEVRDPEAKEPV